MTTYHLRRAEKSLDDPALRLEIIRQQKYMTLALCRGAAPYLVTLNYGFDADAGCFYFHCAAEGKKRDYWAENPQVWGQILEDCGYIDGKCDHAFRTVQFAGRVVWVTEADEMRHALRLMIEHLESEPERQLERRLSDASLARVTIGKVVVEAWSGKQSLKSTD